MAHIYGLNADQQKLVDAASAVARDVLSKHAADVDRNARFPKESIEALGKAGLMGLCIAAEFGGKGQPPRTFAAVAEELAKECASTAMVYVMHVTAAQQIGASGALKDKAAILKDAAAGRHLTTLAFSEKGSRSNFWAPSSGLVADGANFKTDASKSWVTSARAANSYVSSARMPGAASPLASTLYLVRNGRPGVEVQGAFTGVGLRGNDSAPVALKGYSVPAGDLLTENGKGADGMLQVVLPWFVVGTAAMSHGLSLKAIELTSGHLQGAGIDFTSQKLRDLPNLRARLADMAVATDRSRALLGYTVGEMEKPDAMTPLRVLQSRRSAVDTAVYVTDLAMKACGGAAFSHHLPVERLFRDARAGWVMAPTVDHLDDFMGKALTGLPLF
ncbi:MAG: acyl-CoA/acyl-ACP dehydrogenase [Planctomycetes bacterium]|jgi:alkylation response protein AidB-like acyl-CoA dehydrogenase|nr:acyl-CoA/acyl-ACP dehydrogenase [Planctomycetota bacterium]MCL4729007.1 acyl-CoA/acyl-ACP dehydrogenase [Planctomycetota bacterium]